ncbi:MAG: NAD-dependent epimerase [Deltaproteobacteria bacterium]|nr:NAD-dependent epimerase [Deltaproteobacteria bacterium]
MSTSGKVMVTGISGYIGLHCAAVLLNSGYQVLGTVRTKEKESEVRETIRAASVDSANLSFAHLDLTSDEGWNDAAKECDYVMHVASPFTIANPKTEEEMIEPAVQGTLRVLKAAQQAGVKRVVLTSSTVAMMCSIKKGTFGPSDWTDLNTPNISTYVKSKTMAEKAAWNFVNAQKGDKKMELVSVNPGGVFGPPLGTNISGQTMQVLSEMLKGKMPMVPEVSFPMIDVRDVATIHFKAMLHPEAAGERFIAASAEGYGFASVAQILLDAGYKGPSTRRAPAFVLKFLSFFDREAKGMIGLLGMDLQSNNEKTRELFEWEPIPLKQSILESATAVKKILGI